MPFETLVQVGSKVKVTYAQRVPGQHSCLNNLINPLPDNKTLSLSKLKAFAYNNFNVAQMMQFFSDGAENIVEKGENG